MEGLTDFVSSSKWTMLLAGVLAIIAVVGVLLLLAKVSERIRSGEIRRWVAVLLFAGPALALVGLGLIYPAIRTTWLSLHDRRSENFVGLDNYVRIFTDPNLRVTLTNTFWWVLLVPILATGIGLLYAILVDGKRGESAAKSLVFMPMAISFVGASIIWALVYAYRGAAFEQTGLANAVITSLGLEPVRFLQDSPWNTFFLIIVMIWIQAGFAMVLLSAAIKGIPDDIIEAARLDGVNAWQMFRQITLPSIRPTMVVVLTTIIIATLKVFDIVQTMTGGNFRTSVLANEMYTQSFTNANRGVGSALAVMIFVLVIPVVLFNIRQMLINREVRGG
ncbi:MAG TPA: sugar ABC transporter permease [Actinomycetaceae bacterium]|nr:sugar ABC transporter permease [Actinomycetaceae bacterium]